MRRFFWLVLVLFFTPSCDFGMTHEEVMAEEAATLVSDRRPLGSAITPSDPASGAVRTVMSDEVDDLPNDPSEIDEDVPDHFPGIGIPLIKRPEP